MAYTFQQLVFDVLPRVGKMPPNGISIESACNSIVSLVNKTLMQRSSDLMVTGRLAILLPAYQFKVPLPIDFESMAEHPRVEEVIGQFGYTGTMTGTIESYLPEEQMLVIDVTSLSNPAAAATNAVQVVIKDEIVVRQTDPYPAIPPQWVIVQTGTDAIPPITIATSLKSPLVYSLGMKVLQVLPLVITGTTQITEQNPSIYIGQTVTLFPVPGEENPSTPRTYLDPEYLDGADQYETNDSGNWYNQYGTSSETPTARPGHYKIVGFDLFIRPKPTTDLVIRGKYFAKPPAIRTPQAIIPWNNLFDEIFREGVVRIIKNGISIPEADKDFMLFFMREFEPLVNSRIRLVPEHGRVKRSNYM